MPTNTVAENVLGTMGTICWSGQVIPQIWKSWRTKSTEGLSRWLMFLWACAASFLGVYNVIRNLNIPLILQPQLLGFFSLISWAQCLYYGQKKSAPVSLSLLGVWVVALGGFEAAMIFAIRPSFNRGNDRPAQFFGIFSSILLAAGLFPQYNEIWRLGEVQGISLLFMTIDMLGGVFSVLSLVFKPKFDIVAGVLYTLIAVLDGIVILAALILNPRAAKRRVAEEMADMETVQPSRTSTAPAEGARDAPDVPTASQPGSQTRDNEQGVSLVSDKDTEKHSSSNSTLCALLKHGNEEKAISR